MKKLKLVGFKNFFNLKFLRHKKIVAEIYVKDGRVVVNTKDKEAKKRLEEKIKKLSSGKLGIGRRGGMEVKDKAGKVTGHAQIIYPCKINDPRFLKALKSRSFVWDNEEIGGYEINELISKIVEE